MNQMQSTVLSIDLLSEFGFGNEAGDDLVYGFIIEYRQPFSAKNAPDFVADLAFTEAVDELLFVLAGAHHSHLTTRADQT